MEIEQMSFNGKRLVAKGGPQSDVGDGIKSFAVHARARQVDTVAGNQIVIAAQVDRWNRVFVAITAAPAGSTGNAKDASQEPPRHAHLARKQKPAYLAAGNRNAAHHH